MSINPEKIFFINTRQKKECSHLGINKADFTLSFMAQ